MGGKNPLVVLDDADLKTAVECAVNGAFFSTGQRCTASSRLIVTKGIHDKFVSAMTERLKGVKVVVIACEYSATATKGDLAKLAGDLVHTATLTGATAETIQPDGWLRSGDLGGIDDRGRGSVPLGHDHCEVIGDGLLMLGDED